ncbi:MAG TPA: hypothetical protein VG099_12770, partial [Gemmataceae bacterium]|nr:hypothetical protein [Gemmataceae bacterium]
MASIKLADLVIPESKGFGVEKKAAARMLAATRLMAKIRRCWCIPAKMSLPVCQLSSPRLANSAVFAKANGALRYVRKEIEFAT